MKRCGFLAVLLVFGASCAVFLHWDDQEAAAQVPESWRQLSLPDFVREITQLTSGTEPLAESLWTEIRSQSAERLLQVVTAGTPADYGDLVSLYLWARPNLSAEQTATVLAGLSPQANQVSAWSYDQMRSVQTRMDMAQLPLDSIYALSMAWLENRDLRTIENVDQLGWLFAQVQAVERQEVAPQEFSVLWTGAVRAPADGTYTFSICPLDLNYEHAGTFRKQITKIWIAEQQILDSSRNGFTYQANPVMLSPAAAAPIRVELSYTCSSNGVIDDRPAVALLMWEASGMNKQLVPSTALSPPDGNGQGLQGEYLIKTGPQEATATRVDPQLNFVWYHQCFVLSPHDALRSRLADQLFAVASSADNLARWENNTNTNPERWQANWAFLESLPVSRHKQWAQLLAAHPALLEECASWMVANVYSRCRIGAPEEALHVLGLWAQSHCDETPALAADFYAADREVYRGLAEKLVWQYLPHLEALEQAYLQLSDGRCSLPVAYTLSYSYWTQGRIGEWIDKLDARLSDEQLSGDRRVNWLLARAQAEEIRQSPPQRHWVTMDRWLAGRGWLEEATLTAQSEPVRLRAFQELAARLAANEQLTAAGSILDQAGQRCTSGESVAALNQRRSELDTLSGVFQARHEHQEALAREAYVGRLKVRHQRAVAGGDQAASSRYEQLLTKAGAAIE
ncbi:MAG: PA14 domain-containing protein [Pirellulaceae bacterium]